MVCVVLNTLIIGYKKRAKKPFLIMIVSPFSCPAFYLLGVFPFIETFQ